MIDVHAHLTLGYFTEKEIQEILQELKERNQKVCVVAETRKDFEEILKLPREIVFYFVGLHPINPQTGSSVTVLEWNQVAGEMQELASKGLVDGIGEIGLDFSPHAFKCKDNIQEEKESQMHVFKEQLLIAQKYNLVVNVHSRQSGHYCIEIMQDLQIERAILHAFDGKVKYALSACSKDPLYFFSLPAIVQREAAFQKLAKSIPLDHLLLESDAPALASVKGNRSSPLDIKTTMSYIAQLRNMDENELEAIIKANNDRLFKTLRE